MNDLDEAMMAADDRFEDGSYDISGESSHDTKSQSHRTLQEREKLGR